jgi:cell division protein ZapA
MKQIEVTIMGQSYVLGCAEGGEAALLEAVNSVDREMCSIRDAGKVKARERIAVLAALNIAFELAERPVKPPVQEFSPVEPAHGASLANGESQHEIEVLINRIDEALGRDGQLI